MSGTICLRNRQRIRRMDLRLFRRIIRQLISRYLQPQRFELCLHLVEAAEMTRLNEKFLRHRGSTDVIAFDYGGSKEARVLHGDVFICVDEAVTQARRFRTSWQSELVRYSIHALLHLRGFDDSKPARRRKMKQEENRLMRKLSRLFDLRRLRQSAIGNRQSAI
jgi:probable rRNA maturation factor